MHIAIILINIHFNRKSVPKVLKQPYLVAYPQVIHTQSVDNFIGC